MTTNRHPALFRQSRLTLAVALVAATATSVHAAPPAFQDVRALGMGGTGVAAARPAGAALFNPSLLAAEHRDWHDGFNVTVPSVNARVAENEEVVDEIDAIQDTVDRFELALNQAEQTLSADDINSAKDEAGTLATQLDNIDQESMRADLGAGTLFAVPSRSLGVSLHLNAQLRATVQGDIADNDTTALDNFANLDPSTINSQQDLDDELGNVYDTNSGETTLESEGRVLASAVGEVGLSLARAFDIQGQEINFGITPKLVQMRTFNYVQGVNDFDEDDFDAEDYETDDTHLNVDIGASTQIGSADQWRLGASVRNVIPQTLKTVDITGESLQYSGREEMKLDPLVTVGISHNSDWHTITADLDLTNNEGIGPAGDQQFLSVGGELNLIDWINVRAGARQNLASDTGQDGIEEETQYTAGLALSPWALRMELGALVSSEEVGAAAEFGLSF